MWISKRRLERLEERLSRLEQRDYTPRMWYDEYPAVEIASITIGKNMRYRFFDDPIPEIPITEVVQLILKHLGLKLVKIAETPSQSVLQKKE